jgi:hypothetical protein
MSHAGSRFIVKAGGADDHHIERELDAHRRWLFPWTSRGRAPGLVHGDAAAKRWVPGICRVGSYSEAATVTIRAPIGRRVNCWPLFHAQAAVSDEGYEARENEKALAWLSGPHRIAPPVMALLRAQLAAWPTLPAILTPTHGDWRPRNWLIHNDIVSVIDFGRAAMRLAMTDFARLAVQDFRRDPNLEAAFLEGYGTDPRQRDAWYRARVREAIGTAAWARKVGDESFEAQGHRMIAEVLSAS